jgi:chromosome segregation ATPase
MDGAELTERMKDYFTRQIACFEGMLGDLESLEEDMADPELEKIARQQEAHLLQTQELEREFRRLSAEWEVASNLTAAQRTVVRALAQQSNELAQRLAAWQEKGRSVVEQRLADVRAELGEIRRGRDLLGKYAAWSDDTQPTQIDRKA